MVPLLKFYFHEEVRQAAVQSLPDLLKSSKKAAEKGQPGASPQHAKQLLDYMWGPLIDAMAKEPDTMILSNMLESIEALVEQAGCTMLSQEQLAQAFERFGKVIEESQERRLERDNRRHNEDFDQEEAEALKDENEEEEELLDAVSSCMTAVLREFGDAALPLLQKFLPQLQPLMRPGAAPEEQRTVICIMDDVIEHMPQGSDKLLPSIQPLLLQHCSSSEPTVRQCAVYGLGSLAEHKPAAFQAIATEAVSCIANIMQHPESRSEDNATATENAISALGKVLQHVPQCIPDSQGQALGSAWVQALPITEDEAEAISAHAQLVGFLERQDQRILGPNNQNLPHIMGVCVQVLGQGRKLADPDTIRKMVMILQQIQPTLPPEVFQTAFAKLKPKEQSELQALMNGKS
jgi:hypothetical protein